MCQEFNVRCYPVYGALFLLTLVVYLAGFGSTFLKQIQVTIDVFLYAPVTFYYLLLLGIVGIAGVYANLFNQIPSVTQYKMLWQAYRQRNDHRVLELIPLWTFPFIYAAIGVLAFMVIIDGGDKASETRIVALSFFCFMIRDVILAHFLAFTGKPQRLPVSTLLIFLLVLYILIPAALKLSSALYLLFVPSVYVSSVLSALVQSTALMVLLRERLVKKNPNP